MRRPPDAARPILTPAPAADLAGWPGIGPVLADRIVAWRQEHGRFTSVDELATVADLSPDPAVRRRAVAT